MLEQIDIKRAPVVHPLVRDIYLKPAGGNTFDSPRKDALIIETNFGKSRRPGDDEDKSFESYLGDLLMDLPDIRTQAQASVGAFDKVFIKLN